MNPENMCMGCMVEKPASSQICPLCGYDESERRSPLVLNHRTLLAEQFVAGRVLGKPGGFGITYLGWDVRLERMVAIKEYLPRDNAGRDTDRTTVVAHSKEDEELFRYGLDAFLMEARTLARFNHANVVKVQTFFEANSTAYLVMDYYDGMSLESYLIEKGGRIPEKLATDIMMPVLDGLREVHEEGFLHRDIKPHNIYLTRKGLPILLDFGAARFAMGERSRSLSVLLTPGYAPYEQYHRKGRQGTWTDIYACGATLYRMVTGKTPPEATEREKDDDLIPPDRIVNVSWGFQTAVLKALSTEPYDRPQSVRQFQDILLNVSEQSSSPSPSLPPESEFQPPEPPSPTPIPPISQSSRSESPPPLPTQQPQQKSSMLKWVVIGLVVAAGIFIAYSMGAKKQTYSTSVSNEPVSSSAAQSKPAKQVEPAPESKASPAVVTQREPQAGDIIDGPADMPDMQFAYIPAGEFMMGSPTDEPDRDNDEIQHRVRLTEGYYMQTTEVTQGQWKAVMGSAPPELYFKNCGEDCPVENVSWNDVQDFISRLNRKGSRQYRLPTEAEWEYAARAGATTPFNTGRCLSTDQANYDGNNPLSGCSKGQYRKKPTAVGSFSPNAWGLYDMHGNVYEWCQDWYGDYPSDSVTDPEGPGTGSYRVIRGGGWGYVARVCRSAYRSRVDPSDRDFDLGFRRVLSAGQQ